ncbi:P-loop containing nucleoside triphosphate hydrolase protein [Phaeosphaeriaceae sp. PMI808]|nr:P-loop containing nucleoside triphosphate hydrolase protein [Phaeosphaeriaceae sp. PMI808]
MPPLPAPRTPPCLFCAFAARPRRPPLQRLRPHIQTATRSAGSSKFRKAIRFNPLEPLNPFRANDRPRNAPIFATVCTELDSLKNELKEPAFLDSLQLNPEEFEKEWGMYEVSIKKWVKQQSPELQTLVNEAVRGKKSLDQRLRYLFYAQAVGGRFTRAEFDNQKAVADLRHPAEWYPATRQIQRTVHLHVGPTNSGKTYHALKRLEEAKTGIFLGPLRLLAHEVYTRLNAKGKPCALITGEEQRMPDGHLTTMFSCTVEMAPLNTLFDVAVIDEIQMINHPDRGWAWTQAFLGLQARELHLCGEARTVPLIRQLSALVGDEVYIHNYERLTPLKVEPESLRGNLSNLRKGDCIVAFTVIGIHSLRREIERKTGKKCAIVYGSLPPETRAQQARLFNDPDNDYDFLVASDAIGMGLNLAIRRVIFESTVKSNGLTYAPLQVSELKQIAGRAGRYKTAHQAVANDSQKAMSDNPIHLDDAPAVKEATVGLITTLDHIDHAFVVSTMGREPQTIKTAGIFPPSLIVERFANYFPPGTPFSFILLRLHEISEINSRFHLCGLKEQLAIADCIHSIKNLSIQDRITICAAPVNTRDNSEKAFLRSLAECVANGKSGSLLDMPRLPLHVMDTPPSGSRQYLYTLENLHKMLICYLWLSYRFPNVFTTRSLANYTKKLVEDQIERTLTKFSNTGQARIRRRLLREQAHEELGGHDDGPEHETHISSPLDIPHEAGDILNDKRTLDAGAESKDHVDKYPEELLINGDSANAVEMMRSSA